MSLVLHEIGIVAQRKTEWGRVSMSGIHCPNADNADVSVHKR